MNKMLVAIFDNETPADAGLQALRKLHAEGDITLYATGVMVKDAAGKISVKKSMDYGPVGTATGLAVGSLIGLLGGPVGLAVGALTGTVVGAMRDFWVAGVGGRAGFYPGGREAPAAWQGGTCRSSRRGEVAGQARRGKEQPGRCRPSSETACRLAQGRGRRQGRGAYAPVEPGQGRCPGQD